MSSGALCCFNRQGIFESQSEHSRSLGGIGLFQKLEGYATIFLNSLGNPIEKQLGYGETIEVDENHIMLYMVFLLRRYRLDGLLVMSCVERGLSLMKITGPGKVYLSPLPIIVNRN